MGSLVLYPLPRPCCIISRKRNRLSLFCVRFSLYSLSLSLCLSASVSLPLSLCLCLSVFLCLSVSVCLSVCLSVSHPPLSLSLVLKSPCAADGTLKSNNFLSLSLSLCLSLCLFLSLSVSVSLPPFLPPPSFS